MREFSRSCYCQWLSTQRCWYFARTKQVKFNFSADEIVAYNVASLSPVSEFSLKNYKEFDSFISWDAYCRKCINALLCNSTINVSFWFSFKNKTCTWLSCWTITTKGESNSLWDCNEPKPLWSHDDHRVQQLYWSFVIWLFCYIAN